MATEFEYSKERLEEELRKVQENFKKPNILICGQTGAGKSSIVNHIFKEKVADVSNGEPCTRDITLYKGKDVNIYDSEGYEIGKEEHYKDLLFNDFLCQDVHKGIEGDESVHIVWYVINGAGKRFTNYDASLLRKIIDEKYKVCVIISQIDKLSNTQFKEMLEQAKSLTENLGNLPIFRTSTSENLINAVDENGKKYTDWDELVEWSIAQMPEMCKDRFACALKTGLKEKRERAFKRVLAYSASAAAVGATPIPFSDAALLIPIQTALITSILGIYGIKVGGSGTIGSVLTTLGIQNLGKSAAANLIKLFPGFGSFIGGVVNAAVASAFTAAIGKAIDVFAYTQCEKAINGETPIVDISELLNEDFMEMVMQFFKNEKK